MVLAGGQGRRFAGPDAAAHKALADLCGTPLIARVLARTASHGGTTIISTNSDFASFRRFGLPVVTDQAFLGAGPLAGLLAAMHYADRQNSAPVAVFSVPADTPFLPDDLLAQLLASATTPAGLAPRFAATSQRWHPLTGLWPLALAPHLQDYLASGKRSAHGWAKAAQAKPVSFAPLKAGIDPFFNINTQQDLSRAAELLHAQESSVS